MKRLNMSKNGYSYISGLDIAPDVDDEVSLPLGETEVRVLSNSWKLRLIGIMRNIQ